MVRQRSEERLSHWLRQPRGPAAGSRKARQLTARVLMLWEGKGRPRQVRLIEEEEEVDEGEGSGGSLGSILELGGEAQVWVQALEDPRP